MAKHRDDRRPDREPPSKKKPPRDDDELEMVDDDLEVVEAADDLDIVEAAPAKKPGRTPPPKDDDLEVLEAADDLEILEAPPKKKPGRTPPPRPVEDNLEIADAGDELEVLDAADDLEILEEATPAKGKQPPKAPPAAPKGKPTRVADEADELEILEELEEAAPATPPLAKPPAKPPAAPPPRKAAPTQMAGKSPVSTMLGQDEPDELPASELRPPTKTESSKSSKASAPPPERSVPNLSLDEDEDALDEVLDITDALAEPASKKPKSPAKPDSPPPQADDVLDLDALELDAPVAKKGAGKPPAKPDTPPPASDIFDEEMSDAEAVSGVSGLAGPKSDLDVPEDLFADDSEKEPSGLKLHRAPAPGDDDLFADELLEAQDASGVGGKKAGKKSPKSPLPAADEDIFADELLEGKEASDVGPSSAVPLGDERTMMAEPRSKKPAARGDDLTIAEEFPEADEVVDDAGKTAALSPDTQAGDIFDEASQVSEDDLIEDEATQVASSLNLEGERPSTLGKSPRPRKRKSDLDLEESSAVNLGGTPRPGKKSKAAPAGDSDIFGAAAEAEALEAGNIPKKKTGKSKIADLDERTAVEDVVPPGKKKKTKATEPELEEIDSLDEFEEERPAKGKKAADTKQVKPKYMRRWVGGFILGLVAVGGGLAGLALADRDLFLKVVGMAVEQVDDFHDAKGKDKAVVTNQGKIDSDQQAKVNRALPDAIKTAIEDPEKNPLIKERDAQIEAAKKLQEELDAVKKVADTLPDLQKRLAAASKDKAALETLLAEAEKTFRDAKLYAGKDPLDLKAFTKIAGDFNAAQKDLTDLTTKLDDVDGKLKEVNKKLVDAKIKETDAKGVEELAQARAKLEKESLALETERKNLHDAIQDALKDLQTAKLVLPGGDPAKQIVTGAKAARERAESPLVLSLGQTTSTISHLGTGMVSWMQQGFGKLLDLEDLAYFRAREPLIDSPQQKLDTWIVLLLDRRPLDPREVGRAINDAEWVLGKDSKASDEGRAKAQFVIGLAHRNRGSYDEARTALRESIKTGETVKAPWLGQAGQVLRELTDASVFFLPRIEKLQEESNWKAALDEVDAAVKVIPTDGRLHAVRGLVRLEQARAREKVAEAEADIRRDVAEAQKDKAAQPEADYVLGQLEEALGKLDKAEGLYRQALESARGTAGENRYRIALAKVLLRDRTEIAPPAPPPDAKEKAGAQRSPQREQGFESPQREQGFAATLAGASGSEEATLAGASGSQGEEASEDVSEQAADPRIAALVVFVLTGVQPGVDIDDVASKEERERIAKAIELAKELIDSKKDKDRAQGYMILGQALAKQGKRTEGVQEFVKGLEILFPGATTKDLTAMIKAHPAFTDPTPSERTSPALAEQAYGRGLSLYWARDYAKAEKEFSAAVAFFHRDARYFYFRGLSRFAQRFHLDYGRDKRDQAFADFKKAADLEADDAPPRSDVNVALERIQGDLRVLINEYRQKALVSSK